MRASYSLFSSGAAASDFRPFCLAAGFTSIKGMVACKVHADVASKLMAAGHYDKSADGLLKWVLLE